MATEQLPVNGAFTPGQTQAYTVDQPVANHGSNDSISTSQDLGAAATGDIPKDEVGWYFVEQYYTTLSKNPEKLFLFYNKRSQFVSGSETEKVNVCVGQKAIDERIKELDIQDCKVRVTNVDSQGSGQNIVIQVIGEMSNKTTPRTKFTQTFILAEQTNGYFVLNDIFRYIVDDDDEVDGANNAPAALDSQVRDDASPEPHTLTNSQNPDERERDAQLVDEGLKEAISQPNGVVDAPAAAVNGAEPVEVVVAADEAPVAASANAEDGPTHVESVTTEVHAEKPMAPQSTPAPAASPKPAAAQSSAGPKPIIPKTWANLVAAGGNKPSAAAAIAAAQAAPAPAAAAPAQPKAAPAAPAAAPTQPTAAAAAGQEIEHPDTPQSSGSEWQTAQQHHGKKQQRPQSTASPIANSRAYMKNVTETITEEALRAALTKHGELTYLDINRPKNSAFADFATPQGYQAAVAANPHEVNGERIFVEERRVRPQSGHFGAGFQGGRGGMPARGGRGGGPDRPAGSQGGGRGSFSNNNSKDGQRGNFAGRGRAGGARGRGVSQAAA